MLQIIKKVKDTTVIHKLYFFKCSLNKMYIFKRLNICKIYKNLGPSYKQSV